MSWGRRYTSGRTGTGDKLYRRNRAILLAQNDICWLCGHPGATTADHIITPKDWPAGVPGFNDISNLAPAHGTMGNSVTGSPPRRCPTCGRLCNQSRGDDRVALLAKQRPQSRDWYRRS